MKIYQPRHRDVWLLQDNGEVIGKLSGIALDDFLKSPEFITSVLTSGIDPSVQYDK